MLQERVPGQAELQMRLETTLSALQCHSCLASGETKAQRWQVLPKFHSLSAAGPAFEPGTLVQQACILPARASHSGPQTQPGMERGWQVKEKGREQGRQDANQWSKCVGGEWGGDA